MHFTHLRVACCRTCGHVPLNEKDRGTCPACGRVAPLVARGRLTVVGGQPKADLVVWALWPFGDGPDAVQRAPRACVICDRVLEPFEIGAPLEDTVTHSRAWAHGYCIEDRA